MLCSSSSRSTGFFSLFSCRVIDVSAFSRPAAGVQTRAAVWSGSVARGLTLVQWRRRATTTRMTMGSSSSLTTCPLHFPAGLTLVDTGSEGKRLPQTTAPSHHPPTSALLFILLKKLPPSLPLSGASTPFGYNYADEEILVAAAKPAPNLHHR